MLFRVGRATQIVVTVTMIANLFVWALAAISLYASHQQYHEQAGISSRNTNRLVAQNIEDEISRIDLTLQVVRDEYIRQLNTPQINHAALTAFIRTQHGRLPTADGLRVVDANGLVIFGSDKNLVAGVSIADRDYFATLRDQTSDALVISKTMLGKISGKWVVIFAKRITNEEGRFVGAVIAPVLLEWFEQKFAKLDVGKRGTVVLRGDATRDFDMLGRLPAAGPAGYVGQTKVSEQFKATITANPKGGTYEAFAGADNVHRVFSYQAVGSYPLITLVGLSTDDVLVSWWNDVAKLASLVIAFALLSLFGGREVIRAWSARTRAFEEVRGLNEELARQVAAKDQALQERLAAEEKVTFVELHDHLTGLPNQQLAEEHFRHLAAHATRELHKVALLYIDLDGFKTINESLGHRVGDELVCEAAKRLNHCLRETDTLCRRSGDEFIAIIGDLAETDASAPILIKLMECLQGTMHIAGYELNTTASIGLALYPEDGTDFDTLLKKSEQAMYKAKDAGRNTYRFFDAQMNVDLVEQLTLRTDLRWAVSRNELVLYYQPQIDIKTRKLIGVEALIRWNHPKHGMISPGQFIPLAESSGLIVPISEWLLREACRQGTTWARDAGLTDLVIAVNLSAVHFKRGNLEQSVVNALEESCFPPERLDLEFTESMLISDTDTVLATVKRLKQLGVKLSIDDFGTGYSSLSYLKRFEVDTLKIDQSFVRDLNSDPENTAIVRAIIQMAHSLGLTTIAEGVETQVILDLLQSFGCDDAQGYLFARPMPATQVPEFYRSFV